MNDKQRLALVQKARKHLKETRKGWLEKPVGGGSEWEIAMDALEKLARDLATDVPELGPVWIGGKSILMQDLTHATTGIPLYPAFDDGWVQGRVVIAPENVTVHFKDTSANPGEALYLLGASTLRYWFGHLDRDHPLGTKFRRGDALGKIGPHPGGGGPHVHVGVNVELLLGHGRELIHHTDYTHGAPLVGAQLAKALA